MRQTEFRSSTLLSSHFVYVEALDGDQFDPHVIPDDRQAIVNVQQAIQKWKRYIITVKRRDAELIFVVRKGRIASVQVGVGIGGGSRTGGRPDVVSAGASGDVGSPNDLIPKFIEDKSRNGVLGWVTSTPSNLQQIGVKHEATREPCSRREPKANPAIEPITTRRYGLRNPLRLQACPRHTVWGV